MLASPPGFERVNRVDGLVDFLRRWERRDELAREELEFAVSSVGNINRDAAPACSESWLLTRWHPSFADSVEAGVRELVLRLVIDWDCVTYSSCEGHRSTAQVPARVRHVRMVSLDRAAHTRLERRLARLVDATNAGLEGPGVRLRVAPSVVDSDDDLQAPGLDLIFEPESADESRYWERLEPAYQRCLAHLGDVHDASGGVDRVTVSNDEGRQR